MKYKTLIVLVTILLSCNSRSTDTQKGNKNVSIADTTNKLRQNKSHQKELIKDESLYDYKYRFSNDSISQILFIKKMLVKKEMPQKLKFKLSLQDKKGLHPEKIIEAVAVLISDNESFTDRNDPNGGDYFAADYVYKMSDCGSLKIRLDIQNYDACFLLLNCKSQISFLKEYSYYFGKDPYEYNVMKRV
jgi:hypothetical protein